MVSTRTCIFVGLNAVRVLSIVALILVFASSIYTIAIDVDAVNNSLAAKQTLTNNTHGLEPDCEYFLGSTVPNQSGGLFWAVVSRLLTMFQVIVLFLSELDLFPTFFDRFFPVLGPSFGLGALGIFQCLISATILSQNVDTFTRVAAFFLFALGCINVLLGLIFCDSAKRKRAPATWREDAHGIVPAARDLRPTFVRPASAAFVREALSFPDRRPQHQHLGSESHESHDPEKQLGAVSTSGGGAKGVLDEKFGYGVGVGFGFGRLGEKTAASRGYVISKPLESLPRYSPSRQQQAAILRPPTPEPALAAPPPASEPRQSESDFGHGHEDRYEEEGDDERLSFPQSLSHYPDTPPRLPSLQPPSRSRFSEPSRYSQPSEPRFSSNLPEFPPPGIVLPLFKSSGTAL